MNMQRYKWPVIVAASLHGALFLSTPHVSGLVKPSQPKPPELRPMPDDEMIQVTPPDPVASEDMTPASGGPALPDIPDTSVALTDKVTFTTPQVVRPPAERFATTLERVGVDDGPDIGGISSIETSVVRADGLDRQPRATAQMSPDYPASMRQQGIAGSVTVEFDVNTEGKVVRAEAVRYSRREFAEPALRAVRNWHFEPGKRHGRVVSFRMTVPIEFGLGAD